MSDQKMPEYIGTKRLYAKPMNRGGYNAYRGWVTPSEESAEDDGYLVEYVDGGKPNHPDHAGYISWSPKDVFECAYKLVEPAIPAHQQRVLDEKADLDGRLAKLKAFFDNPIFTNLNIAEQGRLCTQHVAMKTYSDILSERIAAF